MIGDEEGLVEGQGEGKTRSSDSSEQLHREDVVIDPTTRVGYLKNNRSQDNVTSHLFGLFDALSDLVAATGDLVVNHFRLARFEVYEDAQGLVKRGILLGAILVALFFGYLLLLAATILLLGAGFGIAGMGIGALILALVHLLVTIPQALLLMRRLKKPAQFARTRKELEVTKQWMNSQTEDSRLKKALPGSEPSKSQSDKN